MRRLLKIVAGLDDLSPSFPNCPKRDQLSMVQTLQELKIAILLVVKINKGDPSSSIKDLERLRLLLKSAIPSQLSEDIKSGVGHFYPDPSSLSQNNACNQVKGGRR